MYGHSNPTMRTTEQGELIGPKMHNAVRVADSHEVLPSKNQLAKIVGPNGSQKYGYRIVERCIAKGLISSPIPTHPEANPHGSGAIQITDKGQRYLSNHE